jgi:hypothetical protein
MNRTNENEDIMNIDINKDDEEDEHSPVKKRGGSSKSSTRRTSSKSHKIVSPQDNQPQTESSQSILKTAKFIDTYIYLHEKIVLELAINLTKEDIFHEFAKGLGALLTNAQIVDPKFVMNSIDPQSKEKDML